jgi:hypothetical protein
LVSSREPYPRVDSQAFERSLERSTCDQTHLDHPGRDPHLSLDPADMEQRPTASKGGEADQVSQLGSCAHNGSRLRIRWHREGRLRAAAGHSISDCMTRT